MEIDRDAENFLVDPESYNSFINRRQKFREEKECLHKRQKSTPGSGRLWTNKITKPSEFNHCSDSVFVKSLEKVRIFNFLLKFLSRLFMESF